MKKMNIVAMTLVTLSLGGLLAGCSTGTNKDTKPDTKPHATLSKKTVANQTKRVNSIKPNKEKYNLQMSGNIKMLKGNKEGILSIKSNLPKTTQYNVAIISKYKIGAKGHQGYRMYQLGQVKDFDGSDKTTAIKLNGMPVGTYKVTVTATTNNSSSDDAIKKIGKLGDNVKGQTKLVKWITIK